MDDAKQIETLIRELDMQKKAYMETFQRVNDLLVQNLAASSHSLKASNSTLHPLAPARSITISEIASSDSKPSVTLGPTSIQASSTSKTTGDESDDDEEDESLYVQGVLESQSFTEAGLRSHLRSYKFNEFGRKILDGVVDDDERLSQNPLLPSRVGPFADRSHYTHSQVFDVLADGSPLLLDQSQVEIESGRGMALWRAIQDLNLASKERRAVGRITIVREPSPILFGAVHYTMNHTFDVDELFRYLVEADLSSARVHRAFDESERKRRSFVFNFEYFTLIGKDCQPMKWQLCAGQEDRKPGYIQISRCSSVIALTLHGPPIKEVRNPSRRRRKPKDRGSIYDPFAPWQVINLQCYPDWKASLNVHDSTKHYVNGVEAFMTTILGEFRDAARRFDDITKRISRRVRPSFDFMFDSSIRDQRLFEDGEYNTVKSYFWAHQTLGIMNESIEALIDAYEDNFTPDVWEGKHPTLWPILDDSSPRNKYYKKKMDGLKAAYEIEIANMRKLIDENRDRQKEIIGLRDALFAGTSIKESRTTIQQGHNIKLLTLVSIFFLPLTFVTSVFGMSNMPKDRHFWMFAIVIATVCIPFFILIGSLNTNKGMRFWRNRTKAAFNSIGNLFSWIRRRGKRQPDLVSVKSFDSQTTTLSTPGLQNERRSIARGPGTDRKELEDPASREEQQKRLEDGGVTMTSRTRTLSAEIRRTMSAEQPSTLAAMWRNERKRNLTYSEEV